MVMTRTIFKNGSHYKRHRDGRHSSTGQHLSGTSSLPPLSPLSAIASEQSAMVTLPIGWRGTEGKSL
jgi:hypothetical protein